MTYEQMEAIRDEIEKRLLRSPALQLVEKFEHLMELAQCDEDGPEDSLMMPCTEVAQIAALAAYGVATLAIKHHGARRTN